MRPGPFPRLESHGVTMLARDAYATLGVAPRATEEEIEEAWRHLSRRYHPDVNPGDPRAEAVYRRIQAAYDLLSDPERREQYDRGAPAQRAHDGAVRLAVRVTAESASRSSWREVLAALARQARRARPAPGKDVIATVDIPLAQVERGRRCPVTVRRKVRCGACGGRGRVRLQGARPCDRCGGGGRETFVKGAVEISAECGDCAGEGAVPGAPCQECAGSGLHTHDERLLVRIPPGVQDGHQLRVPGGGSFGPRGGPAGDLICRVRVLPVAGFERSGPHLRTGADVPFTTAILGGKVEVETLDGEPATLRVPPLTQPDAEFRLRGRGLEMSDGRRGDMLVRVRVRMPEAIDEDRKELVRQFAERSPAGRPARPGPAPESHR